MVGEEPPLATGTGMEGELARFGGLGGVGVC